MMMVQFVKRFAVLSDISLMMMARFVIILQGTLYVSENDKRVLNHLGRNLMVPKACGQIARFSFSDLCEQVGLLCFNYEIILHQQFQNCICH